MKTDKSVRALRRIADRAEGFAADFRFGKHRAGEAAEAFRELAADLRAALTAERKETSGSWEG